MLNVSFLECSHKKKRANIAKAYNKKVKSKTFAVGDYAWKAILPMDQKDMTLGKWSPNWEGPFRIIHVFSNNVYEIEELTPKGRTFRIMVTT